MTEKMMAKNTEKKNGKVLQIAVVFVCDRNYCDSVLKGIGRYARGLDNWALISIVPNHRLADALDSFKPAGIIANPVSSGTVDVLRKARQPVVSVSPSLTDPHFMQVAMDEASIGNLAANHLLEHGLRSFGYFGPPWSGPALHREGGFSQTLRRFSHTVSACYICPPGSETVEGHFESQKRVCQWLTDLPKPVGIFTPMDRWSLWLSGVCKREGIKVPEEVAIIGAENDGLLCEMAKPTLTSVATPAERVGYEAAAMLDRLINHEPVPDKSILFPAFSVVTRQSTDVLATANPHIAVAVRFIREHISEPIKIEDLLRQAHLPRRSFERKFRESLGRSPVEEISRMRIAMAKTLLCSNRDMKIASIARHCGFSRRTQFFAAFRKATGMTPANYRRTMELESIPLHGDTGTKVKSGADMSGTQPGGSKSCL